MTEYKQNLCSIADTKSGLEQKSETLLWHAIKSSSLPEDKELDWLLEKYWLKKPQRMKGRILTDDIPV